MPRFVSSAAVAQLVLVRRMNALTRVGLWLLPWLPAYLVTLGVFYRSFPVLNPCPIGNYPGSFERVWADLCFISDECHWIWFSAGMLQLLFLLGLILLFLAAVRRLITMVRTRLTKR